MKKFVVRGYDATVENVDILGEVRKVGDIVELTDEQALSLVQSGKLEEVKEGNENTEDKKPETNDAGAEGDKKPETDEVGAVVNDEAKPEGEQPGQVSATDQSSANVDETKQGE